MNRFRLVKQLTVPREPEVKRFEARAGIELDSKSIRTIKDGDRITDYQDVLIAGYLSTFESTTKADREGDFVIPGAFAETIPQFLARNPMMLADHQNRIECVVGQFTLLREDSKGLYVEGMLSNSPSALCRHARFIVVEGILKTLSMGGFLYYQPDGRGIFKVDLFEGSLTPVPMNGDAIFATRSLRAEEKNVARTGFLPTDFDGNKRWKYNANQPRDPGGQDGGQWTRDGGAADEGLSDKARIAKVNHKLVDRKIQRYAEEHNEPAFAKAIGGASFRDNEAVDIVIAREGVVAHGIELKTVVSNKSAKITMKSSAIKRKKKWERANKATFHTVVLDDTNVFNAHGPGRHDLSKRRMLYRRGTGSFRLANMHEVKDIKELRMLMDTPRRKLPKGAKSWSI